MSIRDDRSNTAGGTLVASNDRAPTGRAFGEAPVPVPTPVPAQPPGALVAQVPAPAPSFPPEPRREMPPVGAPATAVAPPIPMPASRPPGVAGAYVESYDEITYRSKPGDTFQGICKDVYHSDAYAGALLAYNRNHPQNQTPAADNLRRDAPVLQPGQPIYIPPLRILEKQFPIPGLTPVTSPAPPAAESVAPGRFGLPQGAAAPQTGTSRSSPSAARTYQVRPPGEYFRDIARQALGNADRWYDIAKLNPQIPATAYAYPVPGGTVLNMPADARFTPVANP